MAPSSCLLWLSLALSCEHITTRTNKPCHLETPALVTMLSESTTRALHRRSPVRPRRHTETHTHPYKNHSVNTISARCTFFIHMYKNTRRTHKASDPQSQETFLWAVRGLSLTASRGWRGWSNELCLHMLSFTIATISLVKHTVHSISTDR